MTRHSTLRTPERSLEEWQEMFLAFFDERHCTLFGKAVPVALPKEREVVAQEYAELVMRVVFGEDWTDVSG